MIGYQKLINYIIRFRVILWLLPSTPPFSCISENLYRNAWINTYSRIIHLPLSKRFNKGELITNGFIEEAAGLCKDTLEASMKIAK